MNCVIKFLIYVDTNVSKTMKGNTKNTEVQILFTWFHRNNHRKERNVLGTGFNLISCLLFPLCIIVELFKPCCTRWLN